jgi:cytochrome P450 family 4
VKLFRAKDIVEIMFVTILLILIILFFGWYYITFSRQNELMAKIPTPQSYPFIRNFLEFRGKSPKELFRILESMSRSMGPVYHLTFHPFESPCFIVSDPKVAEEILSSHMILDKGEGYDLMKSWLGDGLFMSTGKKWFQRRKILTSSFHFQILEKFVKIMNEQASVLIDKLKVLEGREVDVFSFLNLYTLDVICGKQCC